MAGGGIMQVKIVKMTDESLMRRACEMTTRGQSRMTLGKMYACKHSPIRTQMFWIEMLDIPTFASTHFRTHGTGITHFVQSNREDRGGDPEAARWTPINHGMWLNAESLQNLAYKRLCGNAHDVVQSIMNAIKVHMFDVDEHLARTLVPLCMWRGGLCDELKSCGRNMVA